eukprot:TRINITY_DN16494_c0_g1_i1.p1 TRINITY_DN16494_c0_g1~~TRINITY_DN16494_c0_g1_i1.p1  ORF type:complete len:475 (+),score=47.92 TRINITY_DN16494_c0_g1_i1:37-1461(+)
METRVFIGGLPADFTEADLRALLDSYCINCSSITIFRPGASGCCASAMTSIMDECLHDVRAFEGMRIDGRQEIIRLGIKGEAREIVLGKSGKQSVLPRANGEGNIFTELMHDQHQGNTTSSRGIPTCLYFTVVLDPGNKFNADVLERLVRRCGKPLKIRIERRKDGSHGWVIMHNTGSAEQCKEQLSGKHILDNSLLINFEDGQKRGFYVQGRTNLQRDYQIRSKVVCIGGIPAHMFTVPVLRNFLCCFSNVTHLQLMDVGGINAALVEFGNYDEVVNVIAKLHQLMIYDTVLTCEATYLAIEPQMNDPRYWDQSNMLPPPNRFRFPNDLRGLEWISGVSATLSVSELPQGYINPETHHLLTNYFYSLGAQVVICNEGCFIFDFASPDLALSCLLKYHGSELPFVSGPTGFLLFISFSDKTTTGEPAFMAPFNSYEGHPGNIHLTAIIEKSKGLHRNPVPKLRGLHGVSDEMEL